MFDRRLNMSGLAKLIGVDQPTVSKLMSDPGRDGSVIVAKLLSAVDGEFEHFFQVRASGSAADVHRTEDNGDTSQCQSDTPPPLLVDYLGRPRDPRMEIA